MWRLKARYSIAQLVDRLNAIEKEDTIHKLVTHTTNRPPIDTHRVQSGLCFDEELGGAVWQRYHIHRVATTWHDRGQSKIGQSKPATRIDQHILWLDVTMHDLILVTKRYGVAQLFYERQSPRLRVGVRLQRVWQKLHHDV